MGPVNSKGEHENQPAVSTAGNLGVTSRDETDVLVEQFRAEYKENGNRDLLYQVSYLSTIANRYEESEHWADLLRAHALYNSCGARDPENGDRWFSKAYQVQVKYWGTELQRFSSHKFVVEALNKKLVEIRDKWKKRTDKLVEIFKGLCCEPQELKIKSSNQQRIYDKIMKETPVISSSINEDMVKFSKSIVDQAIEICGPPKCRLCVVGLGSLARGEATPYSDLEFIFLTEYSSDKVTENLEQLAVTMYFLIGNLRETKLKYMAIPELMSQNHSGKKEHWFDDTAMSGFKIDGLNEMAGNIPTGNGSTEQQNHFICTVDDLVTRYELVLNNPDPEQSLKGDLTAMLGSTVYITGAQYLRDDLKIRIASFEHNLKRKEATIKMLVNDTTKFDFKPSSDLTHIRQMKSDIYRYPSLLILDLKLLYNVRSSDPWSIIHLLQRRDIISESAAYCLQFSFCCALIIRLSTYFHRNSQYDSISVLSRDIYENVYQGAWYVLPEILIHMFIHLVPLKEAVTKATSIPDGSLIDVKMTRKSCDETIALVRYHCEEYRKVLTVLRALYPDGLQTASSSIQQIYIHSAIKCDDHAEAEKLLKAKTHSRKAEHIDFYLMGLLYQSQCHFGNALSTYQERLNFLEKLHTHSSAEHANVHVAQTFHDIGVVLDHQGKSRKALTEYRKCLGLYIKIYKDTDHVNVAAVCCNIGSALRKLGSYSDAFIEYQKGLKMYLRIYGDRDHVDIAGALCNIGQVLSDQRKHNEALVNYYKCLHMHHKIFGATDHADTAGVLCNIATTLSHQGKHSVALEQYTKSLDMLLRIHSNTDHTLIAGVLCNIGLVLCNEGQHLRALVELQKSLDMYVRIFGDADHPQIAQVKRNINRVEGLSSSSVD